ncbi:cytosine/adenosine deaminase-related metal-dependent hydrolase [Microvirga lupini]|uniref:Cytosine/adenosine deaminase-related metal-dependent hydrolase n=1 Tax=Microvirga lupini TaxID=420324 RepID=A0A7W4YWZ2_9HYPH|nr:amidohydrolase family protein [Microvirga lupini]MBB3020017.1 cytosine/adenosine deaminase-related metal-dependent hydrolase [Microvirga lupini]
MTDRVTVVRKAAWVVAWDEASARHVYRQDVDVAFSGTGILSIGSTYAGQADEEIDGSALMVMPGLVNIHCHSGDEPIAKGLFEDVGTATLWGNALYEYSALIDADDDAKAACQTVMLGDLMRSGVTTHLDIASPHSKWLSLAAESGMRAYLAPGFREAQWRMAGSHRLDFEWNEARGRERYAEALAFVDQARAHSSGRIDGVIAPSQIETCSEELIQEAVAQARSRRMRITIHAAQTMAEHEELLRRTGETAPAMLERLGVLGPDLILGHCIFLDHHSWTRQRSRDDLVRLARSGTSVAHCPVTFARSGMTLESLGAYQRAGVNVGIGTDSYPFNMLEELREALICSRVAGRSVFDLDTGGLFSAATVGGATALGRSDIGRLAPGAKADLSLVDLSHPAMQPVHDPLRNLIHCAAERAIRDVYVDGRSVVKGHRIVNLDYEGAVRELQDAQKHACRRAEKGDPQGRPLSVLAPYSLPLAAQE